MRAIARSLLVAVCTALLAAVTQPAAAQDCKVAAAGGRVTIGNCTE